MSIPGKSSLERSRRIPVFSKIVEMMEKTRMKPPIVVMSWMECLIVSVNIPLSLESWMISKWMLVLVVVSVECFWVNRKRKPVSRAER